MWLWVGALRASSALMVPPTLNSKPSITERPPKPSIETRYHPLVPPYTKKVDVRLSEKENLNSHGARPAHQIITMIKWIQ